MRIDDRFPELGIIPTTIVVAILGIAMQLSGVWITMIIAGVFAGLFTRKTISSFLAGFVGVAIAWTILFVYKIYTAQALEIATFFIGLLGMSMGWLVIVISIVIGAFLGGFGGILGRSLIELLDSFISGQVMIEDEFPEEAIEGP